MSIAARKTSLHHLANRFSVARSDDNLFMASIPSLSEISLIELNVSITPHQVKLRDVNYDKDPI
jgi:hypothetical protein